MWTRLRLISPPPPPLSGLMKDWDGKPATETGEIRFKLPSHQVKKTTFHASTENLIISREEAMWTGFAFSNKFSSNKYFMILPRRSVCLIRCRGSDPHRWKLHSSPFPFCWQTTTAEHLIPAADSGSLGNNPILLQMCRLQKMVLSVSWRALTEGIYRKYDFFSNGLIWIQSAESSCPEVNSHKCSSS